MLLGPNEYKIILHPTGSEQQFKPSQLKSSFFGAIDRRFSRRSMGYNDASALLVLRFKPDDSGHDIA